MEDEFRRYQPEFPFLHLLVVGGVDADAVAVVTVMVVIPETVCGGRRRENGPWPESGTACRFQNHQRSGTCTGHRRFPTGADLDKSCCFFSSSTAYHRLQVTETGSEEYH